MFVLLAINKVLKCTLKRTKSAMVLTPRSVSHRLNSCKLAKIAVRESTSPSLLPDIPKSDLNCEEAILIAAAAVKPVITGSDIKSSRNPGTNK